MNFNKMKLLSLDKITVNVRNNIIKFMTKYAGYTINLTGWNIFKEGLKLPFQFRILVLMQWKVLLLYFSWSSLFQFSLKWGNVHVLNALIIFSYWKLWRIKKKIFILNLNEHWIHLISLESTNDQIIFHFRAHRYHKMGYFLIRNNWLFKFLSLIISILTIRSTI